MIKLIRCDDRLIHGQCMTVIIKDYDITDIIVIDDFTAGNPILKAVFSKAVPANLKGGVYTLEQSIALINQALEDTSNTLILMKDPRVLLNLLDKVKNIPLALNVGPMSDRKGATKITPTIHLIDSEKQAVVELVNRGVDVYFRQVPSQKKIEFQEVKNLFRRES